MDECVPNQIANGAGRIDADSFGVDDIVRIGREDDLPLEQLYGPQRAMAQKKGVDTRGRAIKNEYRPISRSISDGFVREALLRPYGPDGRLKASKISSGLISALERQIGSSCRAVPFCDAMTCRNDDSGIENDRRRTRHCSFEFSDR